MAQNSPSKPSCEPLGRIGFNSNGRLLPGPLICNGDRLPRHLNRNVSFFCYWSGNFEAVTGVNPSFGKCKPRSTLLAPNSPGEQYLRRVRGPEDVANGPILLIPYGNTWLSGRPTFSWAPVPKATRYTLQVLSPTATGWHAQVRSTAVTYPADQPVLSPGNVYQINVLAYRDNTLLRSSTKRVNILPAATAAELYSVVQLIDNLGIPEDEKAYLDLNAAYRARGLVDEAIRVLEVRVKQGSRNPSIYRALGDQLLVAELPHQAELQYTTARKLAQASANAVELKKAQDGLRLAARLQQEMSSVKQ